METESGITVPPSIILPPGVVPITRTTDKALDAVEMTTTAGEIPTITMTDAGPEKSATLSENPATPKPQGYKILCAVPKLSRKFENSVIERAENFMAQEEHATAVLWVVAVGPDAYADKAKFPTGPWCKVGDFVMVRMYSGTRFKVFEQEFRLINDDMVEAVVDDPRGVSRA